MSESQANPQADGMLSIYLEDLQRTVEDLKDLAREFTALEQIDFWSRAQDLLERLGHCSLLFGGQTIHDWMLELASRCEQLGHSGLSRQHWNRWLDEVSQGLEGLSVLLENEGLESRATVEEWCRAHQLLTEALGDAQATPPTPATSIANIAEPSESTAIAPKPTAAAGFELIKRPRRPTQPPAVEGFPLEPVHSAPDGNHGIHSRIFRIQIDLHPQAIVVFHREQLVSHRITALAIPFFQLILDQATTKAAGGCFVGSPLGLPETSIIHTTEVHCLFEGEVGIIAQLAGNICPLIARHNQVQFVKTRFHGTA